MLYDRRSQIIDALRPVLDDIADKSEQLSRMLTSHAGESHIGPVRIACAAAKERAKQLWRQLDASSS